MGDAMKWPVHDELGVMGPAWWDKDYLPSFYKGHDDFNRRALSPEEYADLKRQEREWEAKTGKKQRA